MFCRNCGEKLSENADVCTKCGAFTNKSNNNNKNAVNENIPEEYQPLGMWAYFGYQLLFALPCIGFIFILIFSFGGTKNINLRNYARSYFCLLIISIALAVLFWLIFIVILGAAASSSYYY